MVQCASMVKRLKVFRSFKTKEKSTDTISASSTVADNIPTIPTVQFRGTTLEKHQIRV